MKKTKKVEIWAKLTPTGLAIVNPMSKSRIALEAQKMPPQGEDVMLTIAFKAKVKSLELLGFYYGGLLPLWIAHKKDLIGLRDLQKNPLFLRDLCKSRQINHIEIEDAHEDFMKEFRPDIKMNWITGQTERGRQKMSNMNGYEASLYVTEICEYVEANTGLTLNTEEFKKARDAIQLIIQEGSGKVQEVVEPEPYTAFD